MKYFFSLSLIITICFNLQAQTNFKPGYIVTLNGDTTKGFIDYKQWGHRNPHQVDFKNGEEKVITYTPANISAFGIYNNEIYIAQTVSLSQNTLSVDDLVNYVDTSVVKQKVFLRVIVVGNKLSLFVYEDAKKNHCFIAEGNSTPVELLRYQHLSPTDNSKIIDVDTYRQQLLRLAATYATGSASISLQIQRSMYGEQDFKKIIIKLNGTAGQTNYIEPKRSGVRFFAGLGLNAAAVHFKGNFYEQYGNSWSYLPEINAGLDFLSNKHVGKLIFRVEMNFSASKTLFTHQSQYTGTYSPTYEHLYKLAFSRYSVTLYPQILYNFHNTEKLKVYVGAGIGIYNSFYSIKNNELYETTANKTTVMPGVIRLDMAKNFLILTSRAGISTKRFQIYGGYEPAANLYGSLNTYKMMLTSYKFGVNYFFDKTN